MVRKLHKFLVFFYNLFAVTSVGFDGDRFKISKLAFVKNFLLLPVFFTFFGKSLPRSFTQASSEQGQFSIDKPVTIFYLFVFQTLMLHYRVTSAFVVYFPLWKQKKIVEFLNNCCRFYQKYKFELDFEKFERRVVTFSFAAFLTLFVCYTVELFAIFTPTWGGLVRSSIFHFNGFICFCCSSFIWSVLLLFLFVLQSVAEKLALMHKNKQKANFQVEIFDLTLAVDELLTEFNETFGLLFSVMTVGIMVTTVVKV